MTSLDTLWETAQERWPEIDKDKTYLSFVEMLRVECLVPEGFEMEYITLKPVGNFVMGYGPRADLLAVQEVQV